MSSPVIAIDGPAASGKSSTGAAVARQLGFLHLDSGAIYRGLTRVAIDAGGRPSPEEIIRAAEARHLEYRAREESLALYLDGEPAEARIRGGEVTGSVSAVSALPEVRDWVNRQLRALLGVGRPLVVDGRDIGTAVFPDAAVKVFLVASAEERARRRLRQRGEAAGPAAVAEESGRIAARDLADSTRAVAPLRPAADAILVDTSHLGFEEQVAMIVAVVRQAGLPGSG